jgi:hypothetical protein
MGYNLKALPGSMCFHMSVETFVVYPFVADGAGSFFSQMRGLMVSS